MLLLDLLKLKGISLVLKTFLLGLPVCNTRNLAVISRIRCRCLILEILLIFCQRSLFLFVQLIQLLIVIYCHLVTSLCIRR